jgi:hypothetical protein
MVFLGHDLARGLDPALIMREAGMEPDAWQADLLRSEADRSLLLCSRQAGKSTVCACRALSSALYEAPSLVLLVSPSDRQSAELFRRCADIYGKLSGVPRLVQESRRSLELENGSRICSLPGQEGTIRGFSGARLVIMDEAARVDDALYSAVRPMLATTQGSFLALSTPWGRRGWFYEAWENGVGWERTKVTAWDCPRIDPAWLEDERRTLGPWQFEQEFEVIFKDAETQFFSSALIEAALTTEVSPLWAS